MITLVLADLLWAAPPLFIMGDMKQHFLLAGLVGAAMFGGAGGVAAPISPVLRVANPEQPQAPIFVAYPEDGHRVRSPAVLLEGSVPPGASLQVNGRRVEVGPDGLFIERVPLQPGRNVLRLRSERGQQVWTASLQVTRLEGAPPAAAAAVPVRPYPVQVTAPDFGLGVNTAQAAWEDDAGRPLLYALQGQQAEVTALRGPLAQVRLLDGQTLWATRSTLQPLPGAAPIPRPVLGAPRYTPAAAPGGWQEWAFPVTARTPFLLTEREEGGLRLSIPGANRADDWSEVRLSAQVQEGSLSLDLPLSRPLHGYQAFYRPGELGDTLVLRLREAPPAGSLQGRRIVLDAGHGGSELGGAGALRRPEKALTLPIALRVAVLLRAEGAEVFLTRWDDRTVPLYTRPLLAEQVGADVLVSIHANAIPDGRDPRTVRGIGSYYTHPQAAPLAQALQQALVTALPAAGDDHLHPGANLALTRPTSQPSVLLELGYLTDAQNLRLLMSEEGQEAYAQAITAGLRTYFAGLP